VATAVTQGDLTPIDHGRDAGRVAGSKTPSTKMIRNLKDTTQKNTEQTG